MSITSSSSPVRGQFENQNTRSGGARRARRQRSRGLSAVALAAAAVPLAATVQQARADISGFGDGSAWTINNNAIFNPVFNSPTDLTITDQQNSEANSVFFGT